jgi:hypothetical protein
MINSNVVRPIVLSAPAGHVRDEVVPAGQEARTGWDLASSPGPPAIALTGYPVILPPPILGLVRVLKILDNSTDYSIQNTARQALFLPTSREAKYKGKAAIDAFFMRFGDVLQAGIVYAGTALGFALSSFAALNVAFTQVWFFIAAALAREYKKRSDEAARKDVSHGSEELRRAVSR